MHDRSGGTAIPSKVITAQAALCHLRKVTKNKGAFNSDVALQKLVYLTSQNLQINRDGGQWGDDNL